MTGEQKQAAAAAASASSAAAAEASINPGWISNLDAPPEPGVQKRQAVGSSGKEVKEMTLNHMVCTAQSLQMQRQLQAVAWWTVIVPMELVASAITTIKTHAKLTKGKTGHKFGSPHIQAWQTFV